MLGRRVQKFLGRTPQRLRIGIIRHLVGVVAPHMHKTQKPSTAESLAAGPVSGRQTFPGAVDSGDDSAGHDALLPKMSLRDLHTAWLQQGAEGPEGF